jgi:hypothetical protein
VPAHRNPPWTPAETAILREFYPSGGIKAVSDRLPGRSVYSIRVKLNRLGIRCAVPQQHAPRCVLRGAELEEAITLRQVEQWSFQRIGARFNVSESAACNGVMNALCVRQGFTPAERDAHGRLTPGAVGRLRWMLKKGLKGVEIQLRLGITASRIAEERRRYNRELKANGKAPLPAPGAGERYSGVAVTRAECANVEQLFLDGFGSQKISERTGVSSTSCKRIRDRLVLRLRRQGKCLPGCDLNGVRHVQRDHVAHVTDQQLVKLRDLILQRMPVRRAAALCGVGACTAYRVRDALKQELGEALPPPLLPGRVSPLRGALLYDQAIPADQMRRFRQLIRETGDFDQARAALRAEMAQAKRRLTFDEQLQRVADGKATIAPVVTIRRSSPEMTLGGVVGEVL